MKTSKIILYALMHSLGVVAYAALVVFLVNNAQKFFGPATGFFGGLALLMLFVLSATVVGLLVLGRPVIWYCNGYKKEGLILIFSTLVWLLIFTTITFIILMAIK